MAQTRGRSRKQMEEAIGTDRLTYAEAVIAARSMGLDLETWTADAIKFHVYRCEVESLREAYAQAEAKAQAELRGTPDKAAFQPTRPIPTMTAPAAGKGSGPSSGRSYRP